MSIFKKLIINNLRCAFGQKKKGVELGGDVILSRLPPSIQTQTCEFKDFESYGLNGRKYFELHFKKDICISNLCRIITEEKNIS